MFLDGCRKFIKGEISEGTLHEITVKHGFNNVVDAFQNVNGNVVPNPLYEKNYARGRKEIVVTNNLLSMKELFQFQNFGQEVEARWRLVETAWNLDINPNLLEVKYDKNNSLFFIESDRIRRVNITSVRDSLNGYQKGKCFYSFRDISINSKEQNLCDVDHFLPHVYKLMHEQEGANINGVWNLVLADSQVNGEKGARIPERRFLDKLYNRNEFYIESKHPLAETIINQTGRTKEERKRFLTIQYEIAYRCSLHNTWTPKNITKENFE